MTTEDFGSQNFSSLILWLQRRCTCSSLLSLVSPLCLSLGSAFKFYLFRYLSLHEDGSLCLSRREKAILSLTWCPGRAFAFDGDHHRHIACLTFRRDWVVHDNNVSFLALSLARQWIPNSSHWVFFHAKTRFNPFIVVNAITASTNDVMHLDFNFGNPRLFPVHLTILVGFLVSGQPRHGPEVNV